MPMPTQPRNLINKLDFAHCVAVGFVFLSFFMSALVSRTVFERLPHLEDEFTHVFQARIFARGNATIDIPNPRRAYWQPFVIDYAETNNRFGKYPPGWSALLAIGVKMGQMWVINAFFGALTVAVAYRLGREIFNPDVGVIAAGLITFSPMALLLNASLMGHTSALFFATLFMWAYWRMETAFRRERRRLALLWGLVAGAGLGMVIINRPLSGVGVAIPFVIWSGLRVLRVLYWRFIVHEINLQQVRRFFAPLVTIGAIALLITMAIPWYNHATTGDARKNLYTLVWTYDKVGFGEGYGRHGHTIIKGALQARFDLSLTAADLFGWQFETITRDLQTHLQTQADYWTPLGLSFFILPFGLLIGYRKKCLRVWTIIAIAWLIIPLWQDMEFLKTSETQIWIWLGVLAIWALIPPAVLSLQAKDRQSQWTWLLLALAVTLIGIHLAYWVGSQRYTTRYYFEGLSALAIIGAIPIAWLARQTSRPVIYIVFAGVLAWSLYTYSTPRINALHHFNEVSAELAKGVDQRRVGDDPVLVIVTGHRNNVIWRSFASLMALTDPYLDSDIVAAWDYAPDTNIRDLIVERFPDRQIIEMGASGVDSWFADSACTPERLENCLETATSDSS
jgi:4-amino-4-deoxy-L-arabinose transferase-like glycosyltransferase